jgi:hypothetical protein
MPERARVGQNERTQEHGLDTHLHHLEATGIPGVRCSIPEQRSAPRVNDLRIFGHERGVKGRYATTPLLVVSLD